MAGQFATHTHIAFPGLQTVYGADVVETAACHKAARRRIGARHHPAGAQRYGVHLVGRVRVPHDQLAVLRGRDEIARARVGAPMHGIDFGQVAAQCASGAHLYATYRLQTLRGLQQRRVTSCLTCILLINKSIFTSHNNLLVDQAAARCHHLLESGS